MDCSKYGQGGFTSRMGQGIPAPKIVLRLALLVLAVCASACSTVTEQVANTIAEKPREDLSEIRRAMKRIEPFFRPMGEPQPYDWLATIKETGQTFDEYVASNPTSPTSERSVIYVQPLGRFDAEQSRIIKTVSEYIEAFYGLKVKRLPGQRLPNKISKAETRNVDYPAHRQLRTGWILEKILKPALPADAAALIAFTNEDLYPDRSVYFVFGQASFEERVGVWSLYRLDDNAAPGQFLSRTMKISVHEVGHMFSMRHCTKYECVMSGTNHLAETDRRPIDACPEDMAKIAWFTRDRPAVRYERLLAFANRNKLKEAAEDFAKKLEAVR